jgi:hypothetical protein
MVSAAQPRFFSRVYAHASARLRTRTPWVWFLMLLGVLAGHSVSPDHAIFKAITIGHPTYSPNHGITL